MGRNEVDERADQRVDGRVLRGERNRAAIVDALLALVQDGDLKPSAQDIAAQAGVSVRSVFQHFDDMESLYAALVERQVERLRDYAGAPPTDPNLPIDARVEAFVAQRARLYERISPIRRATLLVAHESPVLQRGLKDAAAQHAREVAAVFAPELDRATNSNDLRAALTTATSFEAWDALRRSQRASAEAARRVVTLLVTSLVARPA
jgi:AcrR family transcriptional regulator